MVPVLASVKTVALGAVLFFGGAFLESRQPPSGDPTLLTGSLGYFDIDRRVNGAAEGRLVFEGAHPYWAFRLFGTALGTSHGSVFAGGGIAYDLHIGPHFAVSPSFAPGLYAAGGGFDLGYPLEFRSELDAAYCFTSHARVGVGFSHMSNAHLGTRNPGVETLLLSVTVPIGKNP
jgi:hypothetical protein